MMNALVNVNGDVLPGGEAKVAVFDRGFLYGDSLYEVARSYRGVFFRLGDHLRRLEESSRLCHMVVAQTPETLRREVARTYEAFCKAFGNQEAYCRIIITRGIGRIGFGLSCLVSPSQYLIIMQPVETPTAEQREAGYRLQVSERLRNDRRALDPAMKSGNYLNSLLAYLESSVEGYDDALLCDAEGSVTEGTTFNVFYARRGILATPPLDVGILDGITRRITLEIARAQGIPAREVRFSKERLYEADEVFLTSSIKEVFPVTEVDGRKIGVGAGKGKPGPLTRRLHSEFQKLIDQESRG